MKIGGVMSVQYFKRYRMQIDLTRPPPVLELPHGYHWVPWDHGVISSHADVKYRCFHQELDAIIFPCLGNFEGCLRLMEEIAARDGFLPGATWLIGNAHGYIGTVQGVVDRRVGMIQNLGIVPESRGRGLGTALLIKALWGFREAGLRWGMLEVTAENSGAIRLYERIGFQQRHTLYKAVEVD
jgi:hypothetical protein